MSSEQQVGWAARVRLIDRLRHWLAMLRKRHVIDDYPRHEEPWD